MIKHIFIAILACVISLSTAYTEEINVEDLPDPVAEAMKEQIKNYRLRNIEKRERDGKTVYEFSARGRQNRRLNFRIAPDGEVLERREESQFRVIDNQLHRSTSPFWIQSLFIPEAGDPDYGVGGSVSAISKFSYAGARTLAFDFRGVTSDGTSLTDKAKEHYQDLFDRMCYADLNGVMRLFPPDAPQDPEIRLNTVRTVANYFKDQNYLIYWINGPKAESYAQEFKKIAPKVVVAAPGADMIITEDKNLNSEKPVLLFQSRPQEENRRQHFLLEDTPENLEFLDNWNKDSREEEPWTPNNEALSEKEREEGFICLFDGENADAWIPLSRGRKGFEVKEGAFWRVPGGGSVRTKDRFDDFILRFEYLIEKGGNSGVQVRCPRANRASKIGFEIQILGDYGRNRTTPNTTGAIYAVLAPKVNASKPAEEWNEMEIICDGPHVKVILNDQVVQDVNFDDYDELKYRLRDGFIFLTDHGARVGYRNIRIKPL